MRGSDSSTTQYKNLKQEQQYLQLSEPVQAPALLRRSRSPQSRVTTVAGPSRIPHKRAVVEISDDEGDAVDYGDYTQDIEESGSEEMQEVRPAKKAQILAPLAGAEFINGHFGPRPKKPVHLASDKHLPDLYKAGLGHQRMKVKR